MSKKWEANPRGGRWIQWSASVRHQVTSALFGWRAVRKQTSCRAVWLFPPGHSSHSPSDSPDSTLICRPSRIKYHHQCQQWKDFLFEFYRKDINAAQFAQWKIVGRIRSLFKKVICQYCSRVQVSLGELASAPEVDWKCQNFVALSNSHKRRHGMFHVSDFGDVPKCDGCFRGYFDI